MREKIRELHSRYKHWEPIVFFAAGFLFDVFFNERIDNRMKLSLQVVFIFIVSSLLVLQYKEEKGELHLSPRFHKLWHYQLEVVHFLFGSLLSAFVIFYFRSASLTRSGAFILLLTSLLVLNEVPRFRALGLRLRVTLMSFCFASFLTYFIPVLAGFMNSWLYIASMFCAALASSLLLYVLGRTDAVDKRWATVKRFGLPIAAVYFVLVSAYALKVIPPVPLAMRFGGIYHRVEKINGEFKLYSLKPWWNFWSHGDREFLARNGEPIYCFIRIFAPTQFSHRIYLRWYLKDQRSRRFVAQDHIGIQIAGGREEGFRGVAFKSHYQAGDWRVDVETEDDRVIGTISFSVKDDPTVDERIWMIEEG